MSENCDIVRFGIVYDSPRGIKKMARNGPTTGRKITAELSLDDILDALQGYHLDVRKLIHADVTVERYIQAWPGVSKSRPPLKMQKRTWSVLISAFSWGKTADDIVLRVHFDYRDIGNNVSYNLKKREGIATLPSNRALPLA